MLYLLIGYMWLFVHRPFEVWPWIGAYRIERVVMVVAIAYWMTLPKTWTRCRSTLPVFLLAGTFFVASQSSPYATFKDVEDWFKIFVFYLLVITTARTERDLKAIVIGFVTIVALYELHSLREFFNGRGEYRMGTWRMIGVDETLSDPNAFGASVDYAMPFLYPVWTLARTHWQKLAICGMAGLGGVCVLLTGSRSAFVGLLSLAAARAVTSTYRWRIIAVLVVAAPLVWVNLRGDLQDRYMTLIDSSNGNETARESAEGRSKSFWYGMQSFAENPIFGAGLGSYFAKTGFRTHNLYNQAMGELGIFGLLVLIGFAWAFTANYFEARRLLPDPPDQSELFCYRVCVASLATCMLLFMLGWGGHNLVRYNWLWFGAFSGLALRILRRRATEQRLFVLEEIELSELSAAH